MESQSRWAPPKTMMWSKARSKAPCRTSICGNHQRSFSGSYHFGTGSRFLEPFEDCLSTGVNEKVVQKLVAAVHDINHQHLHFVVTETP
jgi:hypothetical protein